MKERPIIFNTEMVKAILDGRKTQTRRVVKPQPLYTILNPIMLAKDAASPSGFSFISDEIDDIRLKCPYGVHSDRLWVRETWALIDNREFGGTSHLEYKAYTGDPYPGGWPPEEAKGNPDAPKWKPSIFIPKKYARIWLEIKNIRVERLQDISVKDLYAEGYPRPDSQYWDAARKWFHALWQSINGKKYPWESNPWVWVVEFRKLNG